MKDIFALYDFAKHKLILWAHIPLIANAFIKVYLPDAFEPVIMELWFQFNEFDTGSSIKG